VTGEEKDKQGEELFEDLDRFFAPIQSVDLPDLETGESPEEAAASAEAGGPSAEGTRDDEAPAGAVAEPEPEQVSFVEPQATEPDMGLLTAEGAIPSPARPTDFGPDESVPERADYGTVGEGDAWAAEETYEEGSASAPTVYISDEAVEGEPVDVEAAAEHFAASVRREGVEMDPLLAELAAEAEPRTVRVGDDDMRGPSWQEPTSEEVTPGGPRQPAGRNVPLAFLTGIGLAGIALLALWVSAAAFAVVAGLVVLVAQGELYAAMSRHHRHQPATIIGLVFGALILGAGYLKGENAMLSVFALSVMFTFIWEMATPFRARKDALGNMAMTVFGIAYVPLLAGFILVVLTVPTDGRALVLGILGLTVVYDTTAFAVGTMWGDHPLAPNVSPRKSWEGAIVASLVVFIASVVFMGSIGNISVAGAIAIAVAVALAAPIGDLSESLIKRDLALKDIGSVLPGHGGVLDRIDSGLFVAPVAFMVLRMIHAS
jgi:phosphatidate cytidylyltransferase